MKNVIGLDLSLTSTGWSCSGERGTISPSTKGVERLVEVQEMLKELLIQHDMPGVVVEGYSFASRNSHAHSIGELGGVARVAIHQLGIPYVEVPPTMRAKFATGKGNASKNEVVSCVSAKTGIIWSGKGADDMCDAFILEEMGLHVLGRSAYEWPSENVKSLSKIDWTELERYCA